MMRRVIHILFGIALLWVLFAATDADASDRLRADIGLSIFPKIVAVDQDITTKVDIDGRIRLWIYYAHAKPYAEKLAAHLRQIASNISHTPVRVLTVSTLPAEAFPQDTPSAIFIAEQLEDSLFRRIVDFAIDHHIILFSPFPGDVERGATVGMYIDSKIRPYIHDGTLKSSKIRIFPMVLEISKHYD